MKISELTSKTYLGAAGAKSKSYILINYDDTATDSPVTSKVSVETFAKEVAAELGLPQFDSANGTLKAITHDGANSTYTIAQNGTAIGGGGSQYPKAQTGYGAASCVPVVYNVSEGAQGFFFDNGQSTINNTYNGLKIPIYNSSDNVLKLNDTEIYPVGSTYINASGDLTIDSSSFGKGMYYNDITGQVMRLVNVEGSIMGLEVPVVTEYGYEYNDDTYVPVFTFEGALYVKDSQGDMTAIDSGSFNPSTMSYTVEGDLLYNDEIEDLSDIFSSEDDITCIPVVALQQSETLLGCYTLGPSNILTRVTERTVDPYKYNNSSYYKVVVDGSGRLYEVTPSDGAVRLLGTVNPPQSQE